MSEKGKKQQTSTKKPAAKRQERDLHPFETDSQKANRYGNGRPQSGSDGGRVGGRGMNH